MSLLIASVRSRNVLSSGPVQAATPTGQERIVLKQSSLCFGIAAALLANAAFAQAPPQPSGGPRPANPGAAAPPPPGGPHPEGPPPSAAAHFRIEQGENMMDVKCADGEPTRACADIAMQFLDRLGIAQSQTTGSAPGRH